MNAHRLNHHDIQTVKAFEARAEKKAKTKRLACRLALLCGALVALFIISMSGGAPRATWMNAQWGIERDPTGFIKDSAHEIAAGIAHSYLKEQTDARARPEKDAETVA